MPSQLEAFASFSNFIEQCCPLYVQPTLVGVHRGLKVRPAQSGLSVLELICVQLLDKCLKIVDAELYDHLRSKNLSAELYAFPCKHSSLAFEASMSDLFAAVLTLCACTPPLDEVLRLWEWVMSA